MSEKKGYDLSGYVDVAARIATFAAKYPEGSLQSQLSFMPDPGGWFCKAFAYRSPDDQRPGVGHAFELVPGKTPYTKDSEAMNAETSAWGRAIVALGFETKNIASANEVLARNEGGLGDAPVPRSWAKVRAWHEQFGDWELAELFVRASSYHLYGEVESKKLTPDQRKVVLQKAAGAVVWLAENGTNEIGPLPITVELYQKAYAHVMDGAILEVPEWKPREMPVDDEAERLADETVVGP